MTLTLPLKRQLLTILNWVKTLGALLLENSVSMVILLVGPVTFCVVFILQVSLLVSTMMYSALLGLSTSSFALPLIVRLMKRIHIWTLQGMGFLDMLGQYVNEKVDRYEEKLGITCDCEVDDDET